MSGKCEYHQSFPLWSKKSNRSGEIHLNICKWGFNLLVTYFLIYCLDTVISNLVIMAFIFNQLIPEASSRFIRKRFCLCSCSGRFRFILYINTIRGLFHLQNGCSDICQTLHGKISCIYMSYMRSRYFVHFNYLIYLIY